MKKKIVEYFKADGLEATVKYIDPSYMIRYCTCNNTNMIQHTLHNRCTIHSTQQGTTHTTPYKQDIRHDVQHTVQYSAIQCNAVLYLMMQYSTVWYDAAQHITINYPSIPLYNRFILRAIHPWNQESDNHLLLIRFLFSRVYSPEGKPIVERNGRIKCILLHHIILYYRCLAIGAYDQRRW